MSRGTSQQSIGGCKQVGEQTKEIGRKIGLFEIDFTRHQYHADSKGA